MKDNQEEVKRKSYKKLLAKQKVLAELGKTYYIKQVNGNYELMSDMFVHRSFNKGDYTPEELRFIKEVKNYVMKEEIAARPVFRDNQYFPSDIHYVKVSRVPYGQKFENVCEVDIDQAYWETAYQLGVINDALYKKGSKGNISKKCRLTALGSLAKKVYRYKYEGYKLVETKKTSNAALENVWFNICKRVSDVMHEVINQLGKDFIFYWVDGIYFVNTPENLSTVMSTFMNWGYNTKFKRINSIEFNDDGFVVNDYGDLFRRFSYPNYHKDTNIKIDYAENFKLANLANSVVNGNADLLEEIKRQMEEDGEEQLED
jgi:hypothetical protein